MKKAGDSTPAKVLEKQQTTSIINCFFCLYDTRLMVSCQIQRRFDMANHLLIPHLPPKAPAPTGSTEGQEKALKQAFAIANTLSPKLVSVGLTTDDLWDYVKHAHEVDSRSDLSEKQRVVLSARLDAAAKNPSLFRALCQDIRKHKLNSVKCLFDVIQRENKSLVDVTLWHSEVMYSSCVVNIDKMTVRGRESDCRRIVGHITAKDVGYMTTDMLKKAVVDYVVKSCDVDLQTDPTLEAISEILQQQKSWVHLNDIVEALHTDNSDYILEILRSFYRQQLIEHNPYGTGLWFRWKQSQ